jgi:hypothetical protein
LEASSIENSFATSLEALADSIAAFAWFALSSVFVRTTFRSRRSGWAKRSLLSL